MCIRDRASTNPLATISLPNLSRLQKIQDGDQKEKRFVLSVTHRPLAACPCSPVYRRLYQEQRSGDGASSRELVSCKDQVNITLSSTRSSTQVVRDEVKLSFIHGAF